MSRLGEEKKIYKALTGKDYQDSSYRGARKASLKAIDNGATGGGGEPAVIESIDITANGTYTAPTGVDGYSPVKVAVPEVIKEVEKIVEVKIPPVLEDKNIASNGTFSASSGFDGLGTVVVDVPERVPVVESIDITANGTYTPNEGVDGYNSVNVNVPERVPVVESKEITANGTYTPPQGVDGFNNVVVNVPSSGGGKAKRIELTNGGQQYLFNNYFLDLLDYGCEVVCKHLDWGVKYAFSFNRFASGGKANSGYAVQNITGKNVDKFASLKINIEGCRLGYGTEEMFYKQKDITHLPQIVGNYLLYTQSPPQCTSMFSGCNHLQDIPDNYIGLMFHSGDGSSYIPDDMYTDIYPYEMFYECYALRKIPTTFSSTFHKKKISRYDRTPQYRAFYNCYSLDELVDLPVVDTQDINNPYTYNSFYITFDDCQRLKRLTFKLDEQSHTEGNETITVYSPATAYWKNQTIDLASSKIGYGSGGRYYNTTIFALDNYVSDNATYQALKDTENWWTEDIAYSRYNHNSAVETINTLPQIPSDYTDAGNTIKFNGASGSATDGGAINTLTEEEIAVATAKGWTVALV